MHHFVALQCLIVDFVNRVVELLAGNPLNRFFDRFLGTYAKRHTPYLLIDGMFIRFDYRIRQRPSWPLALATSRLGGGHWRPSHLASAP
jgi:hypothetical protein